jgi:DNA-binding beta-propeller fold protein YncE
VVAAYVGGMRRRTARATRIAVGLTLAVLGIAAPSASAAGGSQLWLARYDGPGHGSDEAQSVAVSPDGTKVYVTGTSQGASWCCT